MESLNINGKWVGCIVSQVSIDITRTSYEPVTKILTLVGVHLMFNALKVLSSVHILHSCVAALRPATACTVYFALSGPCMCEHVRICIKRNLPFHFYSAPFEGAHGEVLIVSYK